MLPDHSETSLRDAVKGQLETIVDPCSASSGAPAGLVSMGLVGPISIVAKHDGTHVQVTLYITEPGCMMGALFELTAQQKLAVLPGVTSVEVKVDYGHVWGPEQMTPEYRLRLAKVRACRAAHMALNRKSQVQ